MQDAFLPLGPNPLETNGDLGSPYGGHGLPAGTEQPSVKFETLAAISASPASQQGRGQLAMRTTYGVDPYFFGHMNGMQRPIEKEGQNYGARSGVVEESCPATGLTAGRAARLLSEPAKPP